MPVGTERRIFGRFGLPLYNTFRPLFRTVEVRPHSLWPRTESTEGEPFHEVIYQPEAWAHPIIPRKEPEGILVEEGYRLGLQKIGGLYPPLKTTFHKEEVNRAPLRLRRLRHTNPIIPEVIVYRRSKSIIKN